MAKNLSINGTVYSAVPAVKLPISGGGTASYMETSDASADADELALGATAYVNGVMVTGTGITPADGSVTAAKIATGAVSTVYTATVLVGWSGTAAPYTKAVTINGLLASDSPIVDLVPSATYATAESQIEAWGMVYRAVTAANTLTLYATGKPTVALPIQLRVVRK